MDSTQGLKKVLIISPYFPPSNTPDSQRVRTSLPYFKQFGWQPTVVSVDPGESDFIKDPLLTKNVPSDIDIHWVRAFNKSWTSKFGVGNIALRSLLFYRKKVNFLLKNEHFDLIYFSTTQFSILGLGPYWKKKFNIPFVVDIQDPWYSDYYKGKPASERPKKHFFSNALNKYLEAKVMKVVDGIISVSEKYLETLRFRYPDISKKPTQVITFGAYQPDMKEAALLETRYTFEGEDTIHIIYIGRGGNDMVKAAGLIFTAFKNCLQRDFNRYERIRFHFFGTSYAPKGKGSQTFIPVAVKLEISEFVEELTDRLPFFETLAVLQQANALIMPGSDDPGYTASKIFPYILAKKPLLTVFNPKSSVNHIVESCKAGTVANLLDEQTALTTIETFFANITGCKELTVATDWEKFANYSAETLTRKQTDLFNEVMRGSNK